MISLRVTSIWYQGIHKTTFAGVPTTKDNQIKNAHQVIVIHTPNEKLPIEPAEGQSWRVSGQSTNKKVDHNGYSQTQIHIQAKELVLTLPNDGQNFINFVANIPDFKGIGNVKARALWTEFGRDLFSIIQNKESNKLAPHLSEASIQSLYYGWEKYSNLCNLDWFNDRKIPANIAARLLRYHGQGAINAIQLDPYRLMNFGLNWKKADALARKSFKVEVNDIRRLSAATEEALLKHTEKGHTIASHEDLHPLVYRYLGSSFLASEALESSYSSQKFVRGPDNLFHAVGVMVMERVVALRFKKLTASTEDWQKDHDDAFYQATRTLKYSLTEKQKDACVQALVSGISVITGGAGTGKTTELQVVMDAYRQLGYNLYPMALSGRAAMRIKESTGYYSRSIAGFLKNESLKELEKNVIIIDEASMVDLATMYRVITKIPDTARILLVGDAGQLQPIGAGLILHDVVRSNALPVIELDIVKRQDSSSGIPEYTRQIRYGLMPDSLSVGGIHFHETSKTQINSKVLNLYSQSPEQTQIIGAVYERDHGGIDTLNESVQRQINPESPEIKFQIYGDYKYLPLRLGDSVIFTENDWDADIQNGSLGKLISVEQTSECFGIVQLDNGRKVNITEPLLASIRLAYAISLHKAQGSQFPRIIIPIVESPIVDRTWMYTALTRAESTIEIVGEIEHFEKAIALENSLQRKTWLRQLLMS